MSGTMSPYASSTPSASTPQIGGGVAGGLISRVASWAAMPIANQVDIGTVALGLVLVICACIIWTRVLRTIVKDVAKELT